MGVRERYCMRWGCGRSNKMIWTAIPEEAGQKMVG